MRREKEGDLPYFVIGIKMTDFKVYGIQAAQGI